MTPDPPLCVLFASYLEPEHVQRISDVDRTLKLVYEPDLVPSPRYPADHTGEPLHRTPDQERRWQQLLGEADVLFDFDQTHREDLPELAPKVRWIQATSAGIGQFVARMGYARRMPKTVFTTAGGVHARPLAEFCIMSIVMFNKDVLRLVRDQQQKLWRRHAGLDLEGRTVVIVGVGAIGMEIARVCRALGMQVLGVKRRTGAVDPATLHLDEVYPQEQLHEVLPRAQYLVLVAPHTPQTAGMIGAVELSLLPDNAFLINIARGALVDQGALVDALRSGHLGGASLDVFAQEPLDPDSPLWHLPNVMISPHSASTTERENHRLTDLFCENLCRYLAGDDLLNVLNPEQLY